MKINTRSGIEVVITGLTRNQLFLRVPWVRIPPTPPENSVCKRFLPFAGFFFFLHLWDFSVSSLLKIGSSLLNFLRFELWICSWRILSKAIRRRCYEITSKAPLRPFTIASADDRLELYSKWAYTFAVVEKSLCPSHSCICFIGTPFARSSEAQL